MGDSQFVESRLAPGEIAVFEASTNMTDGRGFIVLFDALEWMEDEKLSACCYTKSKEPLELVCPYETPLDRRPVKWTSAKIWCPVGTTKVR